MFLRLVQPVFAVKGEVNHARLDVAEFTGSHAVYLLQPQHVRHHFAELRHDGVYVIFRDIGAFLVFPASAIPLFESRYKREFVGSSGSYEFEQNSPFENPPNGSHQAVTVIPVIFVGQTVLKLVEFRCADIGSVGGAFELQEHKLR